MNLEASLEACEKTVREHDPDRYFSALFAPEDRRPLLFALYAFNHELAHVGETVKEPMLGQIRLQWWRETVQAARDLHQRGHDVARGLVEVFAGVGPPLELFEAMIGAREFDVLPETFADMAALEAYADATSGNLMRLAARVLGAEGEVDTFAKEAGIAYGLTGVLRSLAAHAERGKLYLPLDLLATHGLTPAQLHSKDCETKLAVITGAIAARARAHYENARRLPQPRHAFAAVLPATLVPLHLKSALRRSREAPIYRRQFSLLLAATRGRI
ncbi:MAG: squalene/phytoene synthase family protein [Proteobacteria bacterium]|nr:squalene/phytoene synthase family protein [Pseudomonadota bacterium]